MFTKKKEMSIDISRLTSLLAHDTCIRGDVIFDGGLRIDGRVEGNVIGKPDGKGLLVLSEKGSVIGMLAVHDAVINGRVEGDLEVAHFLELQANARVTGNITYRTLKLDCGATVDGRLMRINDQPAAPEAVAAPAAASDGDSKIVSFARTP